MTLIAICILSRSYYTNNFHGSTCSSRSFPSLFCVHCPTTAGETMLHLSPLAAWLLLLPWVLLPPGRSSSSPVFTRPLPVWFSAGAREMSARSEAAQAEHGLAEVLEHRFRPLSTGICVPGFSYSSARVCWGRF